MDRRRCQFPGCRAWPRRGTDWCVAHGAGAYRTDAAKEEQSARQDAPEASAAPLAVEAGSHDLREEIATVRALIEELLASELPLGARIAAMDRAASALARLIRLEASMAGTATDQDAEVDRALVDIGMGVHDGSSG